MFKINKFLDDKKKREEYGRKLQQKRDSEEKPEVKEDMGSVPPLPELIIMAVIAKTTVDVIVGSLKVAFKTGKGLAKLNKLRKKAQQIGQAAADYALPNESVNESEETLKGFDPETIANLKALKARYPHAPDQLSALMKSLLDIKQASKDADKDHEFDIDSNEDRIDDLEARVSELEKETVEEKTINPEIARKLSMAQSDKFKAAALAALERLVDSKGTRQSLGGYAFDIARAFQGIDAKELIRMYNEKHGE